MAKHFDKENVICLLVLAVIVGVTGDYTKYIATKPIKVAAFNVRVFGRKKMENTDVVENLVKILQRYDITLVQEIRDSTETAFDELMDKLNKAVNDSQNDYSYTISERLGSTSSKEQYAYIYRKSRISVRDTYQYRDGEFERPPYAVLFSIPDAAVEEFAMIGIHTKPENAVEEIANLTHVYEAVVQQWSQENAIILGDFNADCTYVKSSDFEDIPLYTEDRFLWLIGNGDDTTVKESTECSYDRFVIAGEDLKAAVLQPKTRVFHYDTAYNLNADMALKVSDHYPIEMELSGKVHGSTDLMATVFVRIDDDKKYNDTVILALTRVRKTLFQDFEFRFEYETNNRNKVLSRWSKTDVSDVIGEIDSFRNRHAKYSLFSNKTMGYVQSFVQSEVFSRTPHIYGIPTLMGQKYDVVIGCGYIEPYKCYIEIGKSLTPPPQQPARRTVDCKGCRLLELIKELVSLKNSYNV